MFGISFFLSVSLILQDCDLLNMLTPPFRKTRSKLLNINLNNNICSVINLRYPTSQKLSNKQTTLSRTTGSGAKFISVRE